MPSTMQDVPEAVRKEKHLELDSAIDGLVGLQNRLNRLLRRIQGEAVDDKNTPAPTTHPEPPPSLAQVLNEGAARIDNQKATLMSIVDGIEAELF